MIIGTFFVSCKQSKESQNGKSEFANLNGPYLGQKPPGMQAEIFAPGILSTGLNEACISFSPDGKLCYFILSGSSFTGGGGIFMSQEINYHWTEPARPLFIKKQPFAYPHISYNGEKLLFGSRWASTESKKIKPGFISGYMLKTNNGWSEPQIINFGKNKESYQGFHVSEAANGNLYMQVGNDIYVAKYENGNYLIPERLSDSINSPEYEGHPSIAPDESYLIFDASRSDVNGKGDMYISFRNHNGEWLKAINMGGNVNSPGREYNPFVSYDGKYIFFTSNRMGDSTRSKLSNKSLNFQELHKLQNNPKNGSYDIYWVDARVTEELKPEHLK